MHVCCGLFLNGVRVGFRLQGQKLVITVFYMYLTKTLYLFKYQVDQARGIRSPGLDAVGDVSDLGLVVYVDTM
jgi:hypothetical protein